MTAAYSPPRHLLAKLQRRLTQRTLARPATLRFAEPVLSITFDDFPASAAALGADILERHGARGTYYAAAGLAGQNGPCGRNFSAGDVRRLLEAGHEIGCHTHAHTDCAKQSVYDSLQEFAKNRDALAHLGVSAAVRTMAYPYGETTPALKCSLPPRLASARGVAPGLNVGRADLAQLRAYAMFGKPFAAMRQALKRAAKRKAWVIGFTHDVSEAPSAWGTRAAELDALITEARALGFLVLPVSDALERRLP
ncbi:MAG TPA: polysaccharide deacetylase family protein [Vitreimonas sp.]|uniref:polysaccharide deacetylase family protein n=1 Tax=Vitreimonas sp. TaxID=3069702 RepID=UPI002D62FBB2|nr:polysaccharide deacetylase family protein [Vitreimonas sp.]HYD86889.1 polysaccharide deacetylase family protein [Vitreimonas sp.]